MKLRIALRVVVAGANMASLIACSGPDGAASGAPTYVSTDNSRAFVVGKHRYYFGPQILADEATVLADGTDLPTRSAECLLLPLLAFATARANPVTCGPYLIRQAEFKSLQRNENAARRLAAFKTYEVSCRAEEKQCGAMIWGKPAARYFVSNQGDLLGFELYPTTPDRQMFIRTSQAALRL